MFTAASVCQGQILTQATHLNVRMEKLHSSSIKPSTPVVISSCRNMFLFSRSGESIRLHLWRAHVWRNDYFYGSDTHFESNASRCFFHFASISRLIKEVPRRNLLYEEWTQVTRPSRCTSKCVSQYLFAWLAAYLFLPQVQLIVEFSNTLT